MSELPCLSESDNTDLDQLRLKFESHEPYLLSSNVSTRCSRPW